MSVWILFNEEWYGGGSKFIRAFNSKEKAELAINPNLNLDQVVSKYENVKIYDNTIYVTYTENDYGDIQVHSTLEEAEVRLKNEELDTHILKLEVE